MSVANYLIRAEYWARLLGKLPGVAAIFLSGSLASGKATEKSDIDFFILAEPGKIWTARFFIFSVLKSAGKLAKPHHHAGKICPNHFITTDALEIAEKDHYSAQLFSHALPLYDPKKIFSRFIEKNKSWIEKFGFSFVHKNLCDQTVERAKNSNNCRKNGVFETIFRYGQIKKIRGNPEYQIPGAKIVLSDSELRFHPKPKNRRNSN